MILVCKRCKDTIEVEHWMPYFCNCGYNSMPMQEITPAELIVRKVEEVSDEVLRRNKAT